MSIASQTISFRRLANITEALESSSVFQTREGVQSSGHLMLHGAFRENAFVDSGQSGVTPAGTVPLAMIDRRLRGVCSGKYTPIVGLYLPRNRLASGAVSRPPVRNHILRTLASSGRVVANSSLFQIFASQGVHRSPMDRSLSFGENSAHSFSE